MSNDEFTISPPAKRVRKPKFIHARASKSVGSASKPRKFIGVCKEPSGSSSSSTGRLADDGSSASVATRSKSSRGSQTRYRGPKLSKITWNRNDCVKELRCFVHGPLESLDEALAEAGVPFVNKPAPSRFEGVLSYILLERETKTTWNHHFQAYVDGDLHTERENWALVILDSELCPVFRGEHNLFIEIEEYIGKQCVYITEGFHKLLKKRQTAYNRAFQRRIRDELKNKDTHEPLPPAPSIDEYIQTQIQILRTKRRVLYPKDRKRTITWIMNLLKDIALVRYIDPESQKLAALKVKSQKDPKEIMKESLMYVPGVGKRMAENHCQWFESLGDIFADYKGGGELKTLMNSMDPNECI